MLIAHIGSMRKKVLTHDLLLGMYVEELDRPWVGTPFMFQGFEITSKRQLDKLKELCVFVHVLSERDRSGVYKKKHGAINSDQNVPDSATGSRRDPDKLERVLSSAPAKNHWYPDLTTIEEELEHARELETSARSTMYSILEDARLGRSVSTAEAKQVVAGLVESIIRNPDAMVVMTQLKSVDEYTVLHCLRVCILALSFGRHLELSREELNLLGIGALLHDVGKMKVPLEILNKPDKLTEGEFVFMKAHVPEGLKILESARNIAPASIEVVAGHHERYGGGGYVRGVSGEAIHPFALITSIVDCYDAITSDRVYKKAISAQDALTCMYEWRTRDFHPTLVEQFIQCMGIYPIGSVVELSNGTIGVVVSVNRERRLLPKVAVVRDRRLNPISPSKLVDLHYMHENARHKRLEIKKVLPPGTHGVYPVDHLPVRSQI